MSHIFFASRNLKWPEAPFDKIKDKGRGFWVFPDSQKNHLCNGVAFRRGDFIFKSIIHLSIV